MQYELINLFLDDSADVNFTSLSGYVRTTYDTLVAVFGEPNFTDGDKTTAEWDLSVHAMVHGVEKEFPITIYDYKEDATPRGEYDWHIGGKFNPALEVLIVEDYITAALERLGQKLIA